MCIASGFTLRANTFDLPVPGGVSQFNTPGPARVSSRSKSHGSRIAIICSEGENMSMGWAICSRELFIQQSFGPTSDLGSAVLQRDIRRAA